MFYSPDSSPGIVIFDADSTIFDTSHRQDKSPRKDPTATWDSYARLCSDDVPFEGVRRLAQILDAAGHDIMVVSSRPHSVYDLTVKSLERHRIPFNDVRLLRDTDPDEWQEDHEEFKRGILRQILEFDLKVDLAVEDWPHLALMYEQEGVPSLCVNPFYKKEGTKAKYDNS